MNQAYETGIVEVGHGLHLGRDLADIKVRIGYSD